MNQKHFHETIEELKTKYNQMETTSSPEEIFRAVQHDKGKKQKKKKFHVPAIAATVATFLISGILIQSFLTTDDQLPQSTSGSNTEEAPMSTNNELLADNNENEMNLDDENMQNEGQSPDGVQIARPEKWTVTEWPEGIPEEVTYELYVNENLRFSTYLNPEFGLIEEEKVNELSLSTDYLKMEVVSHPLDRQHVSFADLEVQIKDVLHDEGFVEFKDDDRQMFKEIEYQGFLLNYDEELISYYAIFEHEVTGAIYTYRATMPIIAQEGKFYPAVQKFIDEMEFY